MTQTELLLSVWREAGSHLELAQSIERIATMLADHSPADYVAVRRVELTRGAVETVAAAPCRPAPWRLSMTATEFTGAAMRNLLTWCRRSTVIDGAVPGANEILTTVAPPGFRGACAAAPLHSADGPMGVLLLLSRGARFDAGHRALVGRLMEPIGAALGNSYRVDELRRLREALEADKQALLSKLGRHDVADAVVGVETGLRDVMDQVEQVAATDVPVLIMGETGSGKEVLARTLHERSHRARGPMVRVNCGAMPTRLVDIELFGQEQETFTGRVATKRGWFERANGGTLFLDEIADLPLEAQVRLLRVLQDGTIERVGARQSLAVDVRIIAASHVDLRGLVSTGTFREDLCDRLSVFPIQLPPLRERREDIPRLATHFAGRAGMRLVGLPLTPSAEELSMLLDYDWPGNVRELATVIERAAILGRGRQLQIRAALGSTRASNVQPEVVPVRESSVLPLNEAMRQHIELALQTTAGCIEGPEGAATRLGINPHTLRARMRRLGIAWRRFRVHPPAPLPTGESSIIPLEAAMAAHISTTLRLTGGRLEGTRGAAHLLGINPYTLRGRMRKLKLVPKDFRVGG